MRIRKAHRAAALGFVVGCLVAVGTLSGAVPRGGGAGTSTTSPGPGALGSVPVVERPARPEGVPGPPVPAPSPPVRVEIPAIGVSSGLQPLALEADGALAAPSDYDVAGWFAAGTQPGQPGPAVVAGHVDSRAGPAVFARLDEMAPGDEVHIVREDGSVVRFRVTSVETAPKDQFPTEAVYGPVPGAELRLITCDGAFDRARHQYLDNLVVYATLL